MLPTILKYKLRQIHNTLTRTPRRKRLGWLLSVAFIIPYYMMLTRSMRLMYNRVYYDSRWDGLVQMASVNLAVIFFFVLVSTAALTLYRMFHAKDLPLLMSLPARDNSLFQAKLAESLADAGRSMVLPFPVCLAFISVIATRSPLAVAIFITGWVGVMLQLAGLSVIISLILGRVMASSRWGVLLRIIAVVAALAFLLVFMGYVRADLGISPMVAGDTIPLVRLAPLFISFPTSWLVRFLPHPGLAIWPRLIYGFGFLAMTIGCPVAAFHIFRRRFHRLWAMSMEVARKGIQKPVARRAGARPTATGTMGYTRAIMFKEVRVVRREPHIWIGLIIPLALFPFFIFLSAQDQGSDAIYITIISLLATASYSLSCIGREGRSFALLRSLPMRMAAVLRAKFYLGCAANFTVTLAFVMALYLARQSPIKQMWHNVLVAATISIYLSAFGTALAALFPKFDFTNPMRAASLPGLLMLYLIVSIFGLTFIGIVVFRWYLAPTVLIPWAGIAFLLMKAGQERLERMDI